MNRMLNIGRIFMGCALLGIGLLHFFFPGIRPIVLPDLNSAEAVRRWVGFVVGGFLIIAGVFITTSRRVFGISFLIGIAFLLLFLFGHLQAYLSATDRAGKLGYWVNLNKSLALSGGFFILASVSGTMDRQAEPSRGHLRFLSLLGRIFFALMLLLFGIGHLTSTAAMSAMVPGYIPFAKFWTFLGGIILAGSAVGIIANLKRKLIAWILTGTLFVWLLTLHLYYTVLFPGWQQGENFIGSLTCLAFCGTALLIAGSAPGKPTRKELRATENVTRGY